VNYPKGAPLPTPDDTVIDMKRTILAICWLAVNQSVGLIISSGLSQS
jgi:ubiquitin-conjugating enzyme E2 O